MADDWAILSSTVLMVFGLGIIVFYLIPLQYRIAVEPKDWLTGLKWRLLLASSFIAIAASPVISNRVLRYFGIESVYLSNISAIAVGASFLAFSVALVSVYHYRRKE